MGNVVKTQKCRTSVQITSKNLYTKSVESISSDSLDSKTRLIEEKTQTSDLDVTWYSSVADPREFALNWLTHDVKIDNEIAENSLLVYSLLKTYPNAFEEYYKSLVETDQYLLTSRQQDIAYFGPPKFHFKTMKQRTQFHYFLKIIFHQRLIKAFQNSTNNCKGCELLDLLVFSHALRGINFYHFQKLNYIMRKQIKNLGLINENNVKHVKYFSVIYHDWIEERFENIYATNMREKKKSPISLARRNMAKLKKWKDFADDIVQEIINEKLLDLLEQDTQSISS